MEEMYKTGLRRITPEQEEAMGQGKEGDRQPPHMRSLQLFSRGCAYAHNKTQSIFYAASRGIARSVTFRPTVYSILISQPTANITPLKQLCCTSTTTSSH